MSRRENYKGYKYDPKEGVLKVDQIQIGQILLKQQTDGHISYIDKRLDTVKILHGQDVTAGSELTVNKSISDTLIVEDVSNAYQPASSDTVAAYAVDDRYEIEVYITGISDVHTSEYRSKSQTGIDNVNIVVRELVNDPTLAENDEYEEYVAGQWWQTKDPIWRVRTRNEVTEERVTQSGDYDLAAGDITLGFSEGFTVEKDKIYKFQIQGDNAFTMDGLDNTVANPVYGGTQFIPYIERSYREVTHVTGQATTVNFLTTDTVDFERDATDTTIIVDNGDEFAVNAIKAVNVNGTISIFTIKGDKELYKGINHENVTITGLNPYNSINTVIDALNALFSVTPLGLGGEYVSTIPTSAGVAITGNFAEGQDPIGDSIYGVGSDTSQHGARVWSDETIDEPGEFYEVKITGKGQFMLGLYSVDDGDLAEITNNTGNGHSGYKWANAFYNYGSYIAPWTWYGSSSSGAYGPGWTSDSTKMMRYNGTVQDNFTNADPAAPVLFKVGITTDGYIAVYYYDEGRSNQYIMTSRSSYTLPEGQYGLLVKLVNGTVQLVELPTRSAVDPVAPTLTYYYIESPDTEFSYPLFATEEEANYVDSENGGGGTSHQHIYVDDSVAGRIWYMPDTGGTMNGTSAPVDTSVITYNEIITLPDADFRPPLFPSQTVTINEFENLNIQVHPTGSTGFTTSVGTIPQFSLDSSGVHLQGTAPEVTGDYIANPYDEYTATIYRTNSYGTSPNPTELANGEGVLTIRINNLTAPVITPITGFTHNATSTALVDSDTLGDGSVVDIDETLGDIQRLIILQSYVETYILPNLTTSGDKYIIGNLNAAADVSTLEESDYDFAIVWEYVGASSHKYKFIRDGVVAHEQTISSVSDAFFDYGIEMQGADVWLVACNVNSLNSEPSPEHGGSFTNAHQITTIDNSAPLTISVGNIGSNSDFGTTGMSELVVPRPSNWIQVKHDAGHDFLFEGLEDMPTLQAGYTYRFLMGDNEYDDQVTNTSLTALDILRFTADGSTEYTTGITRVGTVGINGCYVEFTVPSDVPPLWWYDDAAGISQDNGVSISGSSYVETVTGITLEGPAANQTGTNLFDVGDHGWLSIDETLSAGERLVFDTAFFADLVDAMPDNSSVIFGLKDSDWTNANNWYSEFEGGLAFSVTRYNSSDVRLQIDRIESGLTNIFSGTYFTNVANITSNNVSGFIEITNSGDNIRAGFKADNLGASDNAATTTFADWSGKKVQTTNQGFGLTSVDVMVLGRTQPSNVTAMDSADVDWTGLSEVSVPTPAVTNDTGWTKALDFSGSNEYAYQNQDHTYNSPLRMGGVSTTVAAPANQANTSNDSNARPWFASVVFKSDRHNSNQHIWNYGEGAGSTDDNIYLRQDASGNVYFGWGRDGAINECKLLSNINSSTWYGIYIASKGTRLSGANATSINLTNAFDIEIMSSSDGFTGLTGGNVSSNWTSTGGRMDRQIAGTFSIGGRNANRSFHGKIAACVVSTMKTNVALPNDTEKKLIITDPIKWYNDYMIGETGRRPDVFGTSHTNAYNSINSARATQMWTFEGSEDTYALMRNRVYPTDQNESSLRMQSMVSNDIENVTINGLT